MKSILTLGLVFYCFILSAEELLLPAAINVYNDIEVSINDKEVNASLFKERLAYSLNHWKQRGQKAVWLTLSDQCASYVPVAAEYNFQFHHYQDHKIIMNCWLLEDKPSSLPAYSLHVVAIAGLVIDEHNNVLIIRQKYNDTTSYQLPAGGVELGEQLSNAAMREVKEETGIDTQPIALIAFRHGNKFAIAQGDSCNKKDYASKLYFCYLLKPLNKQTAIQEDEITEVFWMPLEEYKAKAQGIFVDFLKAYESSSAFKGIYDAKKETTFFTAESVSLR